jgi:hypothetical protein
MIGIPYTARIPAVTRALAANDVLCRISAPATGVLLIARAWFAQELTNSLNEVNCIAFTRLSADGSGGAAMTFEESLEAAAAFPGSGAAIDADNWTSAPTTTGNPFEDRAFNLATGWEWAAQSDEECIVVPPSTRIGLILLRAPSASMTWRGGVGLRYIGS